MKSNIVHRYSPYIDCFSMKIQLGAMCCPRRPDNVSYLVSLAFQSTEHLTVTADYIAAQPEPNISLWQSDLSDLKGV
ncbi:hypothetical protein, partial [Klebsiella pneumoniae]|uniref:hypothetical protein n=1 Tax=Klebsiella pneumoniae TaxID=573 RepID=UPI0025A27880